MKITNITISTGITIATTLVPWLAEINVTLLKSVKMTLYELNCGYHKIL